MSLFRPMVLLLLCLALPAARGQARTLSFDDLADGLSLTTQLSGLVFSNAVVLSAGISLNELEFPPASGANVVSDEGGPVHIAFASPVLSFAAVFTHAVPLTLAALDGNGQVLAMSLSRFSNNLAMSGDAGSAPNELISLTLATGISALRITGDAGGASFTMDDAHIVAVPEPQTAVLLLAGGLALAGWLRARSRRA